MSFGQKIEKKTTRSWNEWIWKYELSVCFSAQLSSVASLFLKWLPRTVRNVILCNVHSEEKPQIE